MEKKTRTIGILLLVLLVLLITFFGLKKWNTSKSEAEEKKKENAVVHIFKTDSLESIEYKEASGEEMSFVKEDDTWEYAPDTTIALTESSMQNMEDAFSDIRAVKEIKNPDDLSDYGFDSPEYNLTLTGKDGEAHKFLIGNASGENYYFMEDGTEKVYTVSTDLISEMVWQLADVAEGGLHDGSECRTQHPPVCCLQKILSGEGRRSCTILRGGLSPCAAVYLPAVRNLRSAEGTGSGCAEDPSKAHRL